MGLEVGGGAKLSRKRRRRKFPCESIGHRPLWGRSPKSRKMIALDVCVGVGI